MTDGPRAARRGGSATGRRTPLSAAAAVLLFAAAAGELAADPSRTADSLLAGLRSPMDCVIEPHLIIKVGSPVEGILETITVDRSDRVQQGQVLARLESRVEYAQVAVARARAEVSGEIEARRASLQLERRLRDRADDLYDRSVISVQARDQSQTDAELAELALERAEDARRLAQLELWRATEALQRRTILSPLTGVVLDRLISPGELVDEDPLLELAQIDPLSVQVIAPGELFGAIRPGMRVEVTPEAPAGGTHTATVSIVDAVIDPASGTFQVRAELPNPDHAIPSGLRCRILFAPELPASPQP